MYLNSHTSEFTTVTSLVLPTRPPTPYSNRRKSKRISVECNPPLCTHPHFIRQYCANNANGNNPNNFNKVSISPQCLLALRAVWWPIIFLYFCHYSCCFSSGTSVQCSVQFTLPALFLPFVRQTLWFCGTGVWSLRVSRSLMNS